MKKRLRCDVKWFPRRAPYIACGFDMGEFRLYLWFVEVEGAVAVDRRVRHFWRMKWDT